MVSTLDSGASARVSSPGRGHCVVFLGKTLCSHSVSLHSGVKMGTGKHTAGLAMDHHSIQGGVETLLVGSCYGDRHKLWPDGPLARMQTLSLPT